MFSGSVSLLSPPFSSTSSGLVSAGVPFPSSGTTSGSLGLSGPVLSFSSSVGSSFTSSPSYSVLPFSSSSVKLTSPVYSSSYSDIGF